MKQWMLAALVAAVLVLASGVAQGQMRAAPKPPAEPTSPAARSFHDSRYGIRFQVPAGWNFTQKDGEVSTFRLDARSAGSGTLLRGVANIAFNPFPVTNFSGALFYFSVRPKALAVECTAEASLPRKGPANEIKLDGVSFTHGHDESGKLCVEARDEVYTAARGGACYRFDMVMNTFCSDTSESRNMTASEIENVRKRMEQILLSVTFDKK